MTEKGTDAKNADISKSSPAAIRSAGVERGLAAATSAGIPWCLTGLLTERAVVCGAREHGTELTKAWVAGIAASAASTEVGRIACAGPANKSSLEPEFGRGVPCTERPFRGNSQARGFRSEGVHTRVSRR
jgi:hypothetical protein